MQELLQKPPEYGKALRPRSLLSEREDRISERQPKRQAQDTRTLGPPLLTKNTFELLLAEPLLLDEDFQSVLFHSKLSVLPVKLRGYGWFSQKLKDLPPSPKRLYGKWWGEEIEFSSVKADSYRRLEGTAVFISGDQLKRYADWAYISLDGKSNWRHADRVEITDLLNDEDYSLIVPVVDSFAGGERVDKPQNPPDFADRIIKIVEAAKGSASSYLVT